MKFGQHQYQHRFYNSIPHKKPALYTPSNNYVLPLISQHSLQPAHIPQRQAVSPVYTRTRAEHLSQVYTPQRERLKESNTFSEEYNNNAAILEHYRRQAEQYKHNMRFKHLRRATGSNMYDYQENPRGIKTQGNQTSSQVPLVYNPEVIVPVVSRYDAEMMTRLNEYDRERGLAISRLERDSNESKMRLKAYKKKYGRLKRKLKEELQQKRRVEMLRAVQQEREQIDKQKNRLEEVKKMMSQISKGLAKNSELLSESIKVHQSLSGLSQGQTTKKPSFSRIRVKVIPVIENESVYERSEETPPRSPPSVVYTKKSLDSQFAQLQKIKKDIQETSFRIKKANYDRS